MRLKRREVFPLWRLVVGAVTLFKVSEQ